MKHVVITGVSTGIGRAAARLLSRGDWHVFGSVRRPEDAAGVSEELGERFTPLHFDVTKPDAIALARQEVESRLDGAGLDGLVNNAGIAVPGPLLHLKLDELRRQFEVNVIGAVAVTQAFAPLLGAQSGWPHKPGRIVNISSVSGQVAYPFLGPYAMSKHALEAWSHSLRRELLLYGIDVIIIGPGSVATPIWEKAAAEDTERFAHTDYADILRRLQESITQAGMSGLPDSVVARSIRTALESPRPRVRYALPSSWLSGWLLPRYLPPRWFDWIIARRLGI